MCAEGRNFGVKTRPQIFLAQNLIFFNGFLIFKKSEKIFFNGFPSSSTAFHFLKRLSDFFNGIAFRETFFNGFAFRETFFNGFPISEKPSSTAFRFLQWLSDNIIFQFRNLCVRTNRHSPHSLASDKDMYVEMAFQLNLYRQPLIQNHWLVSTFLSFRSCICPFVRIQSREGVWI